MKTSIQRNWASLIEIFTGVAARRVHASPREYVQIVQSDDNDLNIDHVEFLGTGIVVIELVDDAGATHSRDVNPGDSFTGAIKRIHATGTALLNNEMRGFRF